ncbi:MAG: hypothetical protein U0U66_03465 [Cytophagaceae bacterium]
MNSEEIISDQIDQYLNGLLSDQDRLIFEEKIKQDAVLASKVNEARIVNEAIYYASLVELKNTIGKDIKNIEYKSPVNWKNISYISASVVTIIGLATYYLAPSNTSKQDSNITSSITNSIKQESTTNHITPVESVVVNKTTTTTTTKPTSDTIKPIQTKNLSNATSDNNSSHSVHNDQQIKTIQDHVKKDSLVILNHSTNTKPLVDAVVCDKVFRINTTPSCNQKQNGQIQIEADKSYIYNFTLDQLKQSGYNALFASLPAGSHQIMITYNKECVYKEKVIIPEKWCGLNESYSFNPDYNEKWVLNYEQGSKGTYSIYDPSGNIIYSDNFGYGVSEWNGIDRLGATVPVGVYIAFINYTDGRKERVELTIIR